VKRCWDIPGWDTADCCNSCHEDEEQFGINMCSAEFDGEEYDVCCSALRFAQAPPSPRMEAGT